ncbi:MAG: hypothetical protein H6909_05220 [Rickettsiaceae bacterium]|nr:hypothetical protein [Rickettsiaceae bacterium]
MQFFTVSQNTKPVKNQPFFQKKIAYHKDNQVVKPSSSMLLYNHFICINGETELEKLLDNLQVLQLCKRKQKDQITVDYHLKKNTNVSKQFNSTYLTNIGFPEEINSFQLNSVGVNVEKEYFSNSGAKNKHIQIVYSSKDNKIFQCIKKDGSVSKNNSYNELIINLHMVPGLTEDSLAAQLEKIASAAQKVKNNQIFRELLAIEITPQYQIVQDFYNTVFNTGYSKKYKVKLDKNADLKTINHLKIGEEMLLLPQSTPLPVVANNNEIIAADNIEVLSTIITNNEDRTFSDNLEGLTLGIDTLKINGESSEEDTTTISS